MKVAVLSAGTMDLLARMHSAVVAVGQVEGFDSAIVELKRQLLRSYLFDNRQNRNYRTKKQKCSMLGGID